MLTTDKFASSFTSIRKLAHANKTEPKQTSASIGSVQEPFPGGTKDSVQVGIVGSLANVPMGHSLGVGKFSEIATGVKPEVGKFAEMALGVKPGVGKFAEMALGVEPKLGGFGQMITGMNFSAGYTNPVSGVGASPSLLSFQGYSFAK
jgi:hypothetical protein